MWVRVGGGGARGAGEAAWLRGVSGAFFPRCPHSLLPLPGVCRLVEA